MKNQEIHRAEQLPISDNERGCQDIFWTIFAFLFFLTLIIVACVLLNFNNLNKISFPTDSDYKGCGNQHPDHPFLYNTNPHQNNIFNRICVNTCPNQNTTILYCAPTSQFTCDSDKIIIYPTVEVTNRLGSFCMPVDLVILNKFKDNLNLKPQLQKLSYISIILVSLLASLTVGMIYCIILHTIPKIGVWGSVSFGSIVSFGFGIILILDHKKFLDYEKIILSLGIIFNLIGLGIAFFLGWSYKKIKLCAIFVTHAVKINIKHKSVFLFIPIYIILTVLLISLCVLQYLAFGSYTNPSKNANSIFLALQNINVWNCLNIFQFLWGISFLRDSFNFIISGNSIEWYLKQDIHDSLLSLKRILTKNFGSIVLGSLLNLIFFIPQLIINVMVPADDGKCKSIASSCYCFCGWILNKFSYIRTQIYSYINLTGANYINSASSCYSLCHNARQFEGNQSANNIYKISSHVFLVLAIQIGFYYICQLFTKQPTPLKNLAEVLVLSYFILTYFIIINVDGAEGLLITYLAEKSLLEDNNETDSRCPVQLKKDIERYQHQLNKSGRG